MSFSDHLHSMLGRVGQEPIGPPGIVAVLPDDWIPGEPQLFGHFGVNMAAGGAGIRSEILLFSNVASDDHAVEFSQMWCSAGAGQDLQFVLPTTTAAFVENATLFSLDLPGLKLPRPFRLFTKNTAAATAGTVLNGTGTRIPAGNIIVPVPGRMILRGGAPANQGQVIVRLNADNATFSFQAAYRILEKRKL